MVAFKLYVKEINNWAKGIVIFTLLLLASPILGQTSQAISESCNCQIHGEVLDFFTKKPIAGALVLVKGTNKSTVTDSKGHYHFEKLCHGQIKLICRILSYSISELTIDLQHDEDHEQNFSLNEEEFHLDHVEIKARKIENITQPKASLNNEQLEKLSGQNLGDILKNITGINSLQTGSSISKPIIHGLHSNRILTINNGIRLESQNWGSEHAPEIDPFEASNITVLKGASGLRYGADAIGGVIMLENAPLPDTTQWHGQWSNIFFTNGRQKVSTGNLQNAIILKNEKILSFRLRGTYKNGGDISTPTYRLVNTGIRELNYSLSTGYKSKKINTEIYFSGFNTKIGIFSGAHIGNLTDLIAAIVRGKPLPEYTPQKFSIKIDRPYQDVSHFIFKMKNNIKLNNSNLQITLANQQDNRTEVDILRGSRNLSQVFSLNTTNFETVWDHAPIKKLITGTIGVNGIFQKNLTTGTLSKPSSASVLIPNYQNLNLGIFAIEKYFKNKWEIETGFRADYRLLNVYRIPRGEQRIAHYQVSNKNFTATLGANYHLNEKLNLLLNLTSAWRPPSVNEMFSDGVHHGAATFEKGNENLVPEKALNSSLTINYKNEKMNTELHVYHNYINNFIFLTPTGRPILTIRGAFPEFRYFQTNARLMGFDFSNVLSLNSTFSLHSKYSFLIANDLKNKQPLIQIPANRLENSLKFEKTKNFATLTHQVVFQQKRVPSQLIIKDIPLEEITFKNFGGDFSSPPEGYQIWNMAFGHNFSLKNKKKINVSITINNLANTKYRDYLNKFRYFTDEMGRNFAIRTQLNF